MTFLDGYKTYIICALAMLTLVLAHYEIFDANGTKLILEVLGISAVAGLRSAVK